MPSTPTTKSQVQAYRFVLRRMESALVRKDPVMLHDPMRSHTRSTVVGAIVGIVGLVGFLLFGVLKPAPTVPDSGIVIGQPSGTVYVVDQRDHQLIPTFNLASARLLLAAASQQESQQQGGDSGSQSQSAPQVVNPVAVNDTQLTGMAMGRMTGIPDGPTELPQPAQAPTTWAVCDQIARDPQSPNETGHNQPTTTVLVGESNIGTNLKTSQALLVSSDGGQTLFVVYAASGNTNDSAVRAQINANDKGVLETFGITDPQQQYRVVSAAVLDSIPEASPLQNPSTNLNTNATPNQTLAGLGLQMGQPFEVQQINANRFFVVVPGGMQQVSQTAAQIGVDENSNGSTNIRTVQPSSVNGVPVVPAGQSGGLQVNVSQYPGVPPSIVSADSQPAMCLGWNADFTDPQKPLAKTRVTIGFTVPMPTDQTTGQQMQAVPIGQGTAAGGINQFFMNPTLGGAAIRAATNANEFASGPIYVIDPRGIKYSVPNTYTAQVLGVADGTQNGDIPPAPESIIKLLPNGGSSLDTQSVQRTFDGMPLPSNVGQFAPPQQANGGN